MEGLDTSIYFFIVSPGFSRIGLRSVSYITINPKEKKHMDKKQKQFFWYLTSIHGYNCSNSLYKTAFLG